MRSLYLHDPAEVEKGADAGLIRALIKTGF